MPEIKELKVTTLPQHDDMWMRLNSVSSLEHLQERFYPLLLSRAGQEIVGPGLVLMLELAIHDYTDGMPGMMAGLLQMQMKQYIEALIDDEEVRKDAFDMIDEVAAVIEKKQEENPAPSRRKLTFAEATSLFARVMELAAVYDQYADDRYNSRDAYRKGGANPYYDQTIDGLYLEFYYGFPHEIWTPWGKWIFAPCNTLNRDSRDAFMSRLTVREHMPERNTSNGTVGPVYAILAIDGVALPEPILPTDRRQYLPYKEAKGVWEMLEANWGQSALQRLRLPRKLKKALHKDKPTWREKRRLEKAYRRA